MKKEFDTDPAPPHIPENRPEGDAENLTQRVLKNVFAATAQEEYLEDRAFKGKPLWDTETPLAEAMSEQDIARAINDGQDPWAKGADGQPAKRIAKPPVRKLIVAAQTCKLLEQVGSRLIEPGAVFILLTKDPDDRFPVAQDLKRILPLMSMLTKDGWEDIAVALILSETERGTKPGSASKSDAEAVRCAIAAGQTTWILSPSQEAVPAVARVLDPDVLHWPDLNQDIVLHILRETHSGTGQIAHEAIQRLLPNDEALAGLPMILIEHAFAAGTTLQVAKRLAKVANTSRKLTAKVASTNTQPTLSDLALNPDLRQQADQLLNDLRLWREGKVDWSNVPSSLFLYGAPGNGKTLFPHALAGTAGIPIVASSYADCQRHGSMSEYLRAMARHVEEAISNAPAVFFIDELDSYITRHSKGHNASYLTSVVNGLLETLTQLNEAEGVIVIGAANRPDMIDAAVLRAGRFDTHLHVGPPDLPRIRDILDKQFDGQISIPEGLPERLLGSSCADITALARASRALARNANAPLNEAHLRAAAKDRAPAANEAHLRRAAIHEAGHAVVAHKLGLGQPSRLSVGRFGGEYAFEGETPQTPDKVDNFLTTLLAGRAAEIAILGSPSAGAADDLQKATKLAFRSLFAWGLNNETLISLTDDHFTLMTPNTATGQATNERLQKAAQTALDIVTSHNPSINRVADALLERRELDAEELLSLLNIEPL